MKAILWREFRGFFSNFYGIVSNFFTPVFLLLFFAVVFAANIGGINYKGLNVNYVQFFAPGLFSYLTFLLFSMTFAFVRLDRVHKIIAVIAISRVPLISYFFGKLTSNVITTFLKVLLLILITFLLIQKSLPIKGTNILLFSTALILGIVFWTSLGFISARFITREDLRDVVFMLFTMPITFASSMYYNLEKAPGWIKALSSINPLTYTCNIVRQSFLLENPQGWIGDFVLLIIFAAIAALLANLSLRKLSI